MDSPKVPQYLCHKKVWALKISHIEDDGVGSVVMHFQDGYAPRPAAESLFARYMPVEGDYWVMYEDGYESISPAKSFEDGYTLVAPSGDPG